MKRGIKVRLCLGGLLLLGSGGGLYWTTTPSYALFDIAYLSKDLERRVDVDSISKNLTDAAITEISSQAMSNMQSSQDSFSQLGTALGVGLIQQMRPAIELKVKEELSKNIKDANQRISKGALPSVSRINRLGDEAIVGFNREGKEVEVVMEKQNGSWKFTKFSDKTTKGFLKEFQQKQSAITANAPTTSPPTVSSSPTVSPAPVPVSPPAETIVPKSQFVGTNQASLTSNGFNAEIFDPPSNCRTNPGTNNSVQKVLQKGNVLVDPNNPQTDSEGELWYQEKYLGCWLHHSQIRFK